MRNKDVFSWRIYDDDDDDDDGDEDEDWKITKS